MQKPYKNLTLRKASVEDAAFLFELRNDPLTRKSSIHQGKIKKKEHFSWLTKLLKNRRRELFIAEFNGVAIGSIRSDYKEGSCELSWTISSRARGKGFGKLMVSTLSGTINEPVTARIREENTASIHIAEYCDMVLNGKEQGILFYKRGPL